MGKGSAILLQTIIVLLGVSVLAFMLWEPHLEGRNAGATLFQIYFNDPFLVYAYTASIAFFTALYQAFKVLGYIRQNKMFSEATIKSLRTIKHCGIILLGFFLAAEAYLFIVRPGDDIAGGVFIGLLGIVVSGTISSVAERVGEIVQNTVDIKFKNY